MPGGQNKILLVVVAKLLLCCCKNDPWFDSLPGTTGLVQLATGTWRSPLDYSAFHLYNKAFILRLPVAPSLDGAGWRGAIPTSHKVEDESSRGWKFYSVFTRIRFDMLPLVKDRLGLSCKSKIIISPISIMSCNTWKSECTCNFKCTYKYLYLNRACNIQISR